MLPIHIGYRNLNNYSAYSRRGNPLAVGAKLLAMAGFAVMSLEGGLGHHIWRDNIRADKSAS